ncbi:MAG TPA: polysaccharide biosynthesis/export family protein [Polyangiaceae bacterium]|nr:polysaccharide biosynthesis/export family protein [Polyangiaceae bacterium]
MLPYLTFRARSVFAHFASICLLALIPALAGGCASAGAFTWYEDIPKGPDWNTDNSEYVIGVADTISIRAYEQEGLSGSYKVRRDGRIALPLAGELVVAGKHPSQLAKEIEVLLKQFIVTPRVTVNVEASQPVTVTALGEIKNIGALTLEPPARLVEAIAQAGGPGEFADKSRIFVLRRFPQFQRIRFTYDAIVHNDGGAANFPLRTGDVIVIE